MDCLISLVKEYIVDMWEIQKHNYKIVTEDLVNNSIVSLHLGTWLWLKGRRMVS